MKLGPRQKKWLRDLPKYAKARNALYAPGEGFCCLGVYADTQIEEPWEEVTGVFGGSQLGYKIGHIACTTDLAPSDYKKLGLKQEFCPPIRIGDRAFCDIAEVNDGGPFTDHQQMADFIKAHADEIFERPA